MIHQTCLLPSLQPSANLQKELTRAISWNIFLPSGEYLTFNVHPITYYYDGPNAPHRASYGPDETGLTVPCTTEPVGVTPMFWDMSPGQALLLRLPKDSVEPWKVERFAYVYVICYCHGAHPTSPRGSPEAWNHWVSFCRVLFMMPKFIPYLEAPRMQMIAVESEEFTERLWQAYLKRISGVASPDEHHGAFKEAVTEVTQGIQRPRLVLDAQRDFIDRAVSRFHWVELPVPPGVPSLTTSTAAKEQNPCLACRAVKLPICICVC